MNRRWIMPAVVACFFGGGLAHCGSSSEPTPGGPSGTSSYEGVIAANDGRAGVITLSLQSSSLKTLRLRDAASSLSGSITLAPYGTVKLTGSYDPATGKIKAHASSAFGDVDLEGIVEADGITLEWTGGGRAKLGAGSAGEGAYFCGQYSGDGKSGGFHVVTRAAKAYALVSDGSAVTIVDGERTGTGHVKVRFPPSGSAEGDIAGKALSGTWLDGTGKKGALDASRDKCLEAFGPDGGVAESGTETGIEAGTETGISYGVRAVGRGPNTTHVCVSTGADLGVYCWGSMESALFGDAIADGAPPSLASQRRMTPVQVKGPDGVGTLKTVVGLATADSHTCALIGASGEVYCWGTNDKGQLGDGTKIDRPFPVKVKGVGGTGFLTGVKQIAASNAVTCAIGAFGAACWGDNGTWGALGIPELVPTDSSTPVVLGTVAGPKWIDVGESSACAIRGSDGAVLCWGGFYDGTGITGPKPLPGPGGTGTFTGALSVSVGFAHGCIHKSDNTVWCYGNVLASDPMKVFPTLTVMGGSGVAGVNHPTQVKGVGGTGLLTAIDGVTVGLRHSCAHHSGGDAFCWGANDKGQLGDGSTIDTATPVKVKGIVDSTGAWAVFDTTLHRRIDGTLWGAGANFDNLARANLGANVTAPEKINGFPY